MFFEDFSPGDRFTTGSRTMGEAEIIAFASQWDRQFFHLDAQAAKASIFGGLIASGFHTLLVTFDLIVEAAIWTEFEPGLARDGELALADSRSPGRHADRGAGGRRDDALAKG